MSAPQIVLASGNQNKVRELQQLLAATDYHIVPQSDFGVSPAVEDGLSFVENALIKARHAAAHSGLPAIADDSGIAVDALNGAPGIYSARYAGEGATDEQNLHHLLTQMRAVDADKRAAKFICLMVYVRHAKDPVPMICQGVWEGRLLDHPQGENGFGYDPIFYVPEKKCSSAQLSSDEKNAISHRGKAMRCLVERLARLSQ